MIYPNSPKSRNSLKSLNKRGSILIWTVLLGVAMASAFFFISMRLGGMGGIQRESIEYKNQEAYLNSYADYLMSLSPAQLETIKGDLNFDQIPDTTPPEYVITGTLTNNVDEITGALDEGGSVEYNFSGDINVYWNLCSNNNKENIFIEGTEYTHHPGSSCPPSTSNYDDVATVTATDPLTISTKNAPINYKITPVAPTQLIDNVWHLKAKIDLGYGKKIEVERWF